MDKPTGNWFLLAMVNGIEKLSKLSLIGRPESVDAIKAVAEVFEEAVKPGLIWVWDRDIPRIAVAFRSLAQGVRANSRDGNRFPTPIDFRAALPAVEKLTEIEAPPAYRMPHDEAKVRIKAMTERLTKPDEEKIENARPPDPSDKLGRVNWTRKRKGLPEFETQADWDEWAARAQARQTEALEKMGEHE